MSYGHNIPRACRSDDLWGKGKMPLNFIGKYLQMSIPTRLGEVVGLLNNTQA